MTLDDCVFYQLGSAYKSTLASSNKLRYDAGNFIK